MKRNHLVSILAIAALFLPVAADARVVSYQGGNLDCETGILTDNLGATSTVQVETVGLCISTGNGSPLFVMQPWGLTASDSQKLVVPSGSIVKDEAGIQFLCPTFYGLFGCYNLTGLDYWKNQARVLAKADAPGYSYWLTH